MDKARNGEEKKRIFESHAYGGAGTPRGRFPKSAANVITVSCDVMKTTLRYPIRHFRKNELAAFFFSTKV